MIIRGRDTKETLSDNYGRYTREHVRCVCGHVGPAEVQSCFIPTQPATNQKEMVCEACGSNRVEHYEGER